MFLYTTETVINFPVAKDVHGNPLLDSTGTEVPKYVGTADAFKVVGTGTFPKDTIKAVYKRAYSDGVKEIATLEVPTLNIGTILRITVYVQLEEAVQSDYVNFSYDFKQPITVEVTGSGDKEVDATNLAKTLNKIKTEYGRSLFITKTDSKYKETLIFIARDFNQRFKSIVLESINPVNNPVSPIIKVEKEGTVDTKGKIGFGDDSWMFRAVELPTYENVRHYRTRLHEKPILGAKYTQFTLKQETDAGEGMGIWQANNKAVVNHVFWVRADLVSAFEGALNATVDPNDDTPFIETIA